MVSSLDDALQTDTVETALALGLHGMLEEVTPSTSALIFNQYRLISVTADFLLFSSASSSGRFGLFFFYFF
jgi:hypothetical protein